MSPKRPRIAIFCRRWRARAPIVSPHEGSPWHGPATATGDANRGTLARLANARIPRPPRFHVVRDRSSGTVCGVMQDGCRDRATRQAASADAAHPPSGDVAADLAGDRSGPASGDDPWALGPLPRDRSRLRHDSATNPSQLSPLRQRVGFDYLRDPARTTRRSSRPRLPSRPGARMPTTAHEIPTEARS